MPSLQTKSSDSPQNELIECKNYAMETILYMNIGAWYP